MLQDLPQHWQLWSSVPVVIFKVKPDFAVTESFFTPRSMYVQLCLEISLSKMRLILLCIIIVTSVTKKGMKVLWLLLLMLTFLSQKYNEILNLPFCFGHELGKYYEMIGL